jgi:hypothetical protein
VIHAEGELQASEKLFQAARILAQEPQAIQLRYLETLRRRKTIIFTKGEGCNMLATRAKLYAHGQQEIPSRKRTRVAQAPGHDE